MTNPNPLVCPKPDPTTSIPVRVYYNLRSKLWSVQDRRTCRVVDHLALLTVRNAKFVVRPAGRQKVLDTKVKNVHAFVVGEWDGTSFVPEIDATTHEKVGYNPFRSAHFETKPEGAPVESADEVVMFADRSVFAKGLSEVFE